MPPRRQLPLPNLPISLEDLPPPEAKRTRRLSLSLAENEMSMIERAARQRQELPAVFCRTIVLSAFENTALLALGGKPDLLDLPVAEQQKALLEAFDFKETPSRRRHAPAKLPAPETLPRTIRVAMVFTENEMAMIEKAARERGEQPGVFCRTLILTAIQNSERKATTPKPQLSPLEMQKALLEAFTFDED